MKKFSLLLSFVLFFSIAGQAQTLDKVFKKYADNENFEYTSVGKGMMGILSLFADYSVISDGTLQKINSVKILKLDASAANQSLSQAFSGEIDKVIEKGKFESTLEKRDKSSKTYIYKRVDNRLNADVLVVTTDTKGITTIWLKGKASPDALNDDTENL